MLVSLMDPKRATITFVVLYLCSYVVISGTVGVYWAGLALGWW
tara:strand:- start:346 stop:474 length:129 start_codon:yes stop_codon:yes gene_type:complete